MTSESYRLTPDQHEAIYQNDIKPDLFADATPSDKPVAIIFGGQPGSGKSPAVDAAVRELEQSGGVVQIIGDDLRAYHPHHIALMAMDDTEASVHTGPDSGKWVEKAIAYASEQRYNMVIEGTMRDANTVAKTMTSLRKAGYLIDARALAVNERLSWQGVLMRYEQQKADRGSGRMTTPAAHQAGYVGVPITVARIEREKLADKLTVYRRGAVVLYTNELGADGEWIKPTQGREVIDQERARRLDYQERQSYLASYDKLVAMVEAPGRYANADEIDSMKDLRITATNALAAEVFLNSPKQEALKEFPTLSGAYQRLEAVEKQINVDRLDAEQKRFVLSFAKANAAIAIEVGNYKAAVVQQEEKSQDQSLTL